MKNIITLLIIVCSFTACTNSKKATDTPAPANTVNSSSTLDGTWQLTYISFPGLAFDSIYSGKKPVITFNTADKKINGNTSCNSFNGQFSIEGRSVGFREPMAMTKMACPGEGEFVFLETLKKVNAYDIKDNNLHLIMGDIVLMRLSRSK